MPRGWWFLVICVKSFDNAIQDILDTVAYLVNLGDELGIILNQDSPDHGTDGVHYPHPVLLQVSVRLHVAKVSCLHTRVSGKEAESHLCR